MSSPQVGQGSALDVLQVPADPTGDAEQEPGADRRPEGERRSAESRANSFARARHWLLKNRDKVARPIPWLLLFLAPFGVAVIDDFLAQSREARDFEKRAALDDRQFLREERSQKYSALNDALAAYVSALESCRKSCAGDRVGLAREALDRALAGVHAYGSLEATKVAEGIDYYLRVNSRSSAHFRAIAEDLQQRIYLEILGG